MPKPALLLWDESEESLLDGALSERFTLIRLWQTDNPTNLLHARGHEVIAAFTTRFDAWVLDDLPYLRLVVIPGAGYEYVDIAAIRARGITVANAGNTHSGDAADHAVALTLASIHRLVEGHAWMREGHWTQTGEPTRRHAMSAQRFGIVGLGNIGSAIARRLAAFGGELAWWSRHDKRTPWPRRDSLLDLAQWCTTLIVAARGDAIGLINAETIAAVGPDGLIVNISRGAVIDENALIAALIDGRLGAAALDVFDKEPSPAERWHDVPNVILSPHISGVSHESLARLRGAAIRNLLTALDGGPLVNEVMT